MYFNKVSRCPAICITAALAVACAVLAGCSDQTQSSSASDGPVVAAAFYPLEEMVDAVAGGAVEVQALTPPGQSPHDLELTPKQVEDLSNASAVFYLGQGFQPQVEEAVAQLDDSVLKVDLLDSVDLLGVEGKLDGTQGETDGEVLASGKDPHVWVSPKNMAAMTDVVAATMQELVPTDKDDVAANASAYAAGMNELDKEFRAGLATCGSRTIVTSHRAFAYLAEDFGLEQVAIAGISPGVEPAPQTLAAVAAKAKADGVTTIYFENNLPSELSEVIAREVGATTDVLDPIESLSSQQLKDDANYAAIQKANLSALRKGLRCE